MKTILALVVVALLSSHRADACQLKEPISPLNNLYGATSVIWGEVIVVKDGDILVRRRDTFSGSHTGDVHLEVSECEGGLPVGSMVAVAVDKPSGMIYPIVRWPEEPENQALIIAFAKAKSDAEIGKVLAAHVRKGWASYVDFPMIAMFLARTPSVVNTLSRADAKAMLRDLSRHPRAKADATKALAARAR